MGDVAVICVLGVGRDPENAIGQRYGIHRVGCVPSFPIGYQRGGQSSPGITARLRRTQGCLGPRQWR